MPRGRSALPPLPETEVAQASPSRTIELDIPAQDLDTALTALADQIGLELLYASGQVAGLRTPDGDLALGFDNAALLTNGKEALGNIDGSFGLDMEEAGQLRLTGTFGYVDFVERYATNPGVYRETFGSLSEEPKGDQSFRRSYTLNLSYENADILGQSVKLEAFTSSVDTETFSTSDGTNFRDEQTNEYYGFRSAVTTPLDVGTEGSAVTYGVDVLRNRYFRPLFNDDSRSSLYARMTSGVAEARE